MHASTPRSLKRSRAGTRRLGTLLVAVICKAACLLALFQVACPGLESRAEEAESLEIELLAHPVQRSAGISLSRVVVRFQPKSHNPGDSARAQALTTAYGFHLSAATGHRLANGLLAPLRC